jgi:spermidine/putrescine transport system substrate-binding protein
MLFEREVIVRIHKTNFARVSASLFSSLILCCVSFSGVYAIDAGKTNELVLLNWSEYMDPELIAKFEKQYNAEVTEVYFESDDARDDMMVATDASGYDIAVVNGITLTSYAKAGWIQPIKKEKIPNLKHIIPQMRDVFPDSREYAVPFFFGTVGIAYRSDLVKKTPTSWMDIFKPEAYLHGKIGMSSDVRDTFGAALKALGYSVNSADLIENRQAGELLVHQKPFVKTYNYLTLDADSALVSGDIYMALFYNGDALMVAEHNDAIEFLVPDEGGNLWIDYLAVMKKAPNSELAWKFMNFLNEPENAAQLAEFVHYATPNKSAEKLLPSERLDHPVLYPSAEIIDKSEFDGVIPARIQKIRNATISGLLQE